MPGLPQRNDHPNQFGNGSTASDFHSLSCSNGSVSANGFWSKHRDDVSYNQLHKFWTELSPQARQKLVRIDKQTLFEQARKNMYCSRCNGLLLEGFLQIVMYGKSLQQEGAGNLHCNRLGTSNNQIDLDLCTTNGCQHDVQDPSVHPWGGLTTTRDGILTLLDSYLYSESLKVLQNVFDSGRARERERELLYPDACGGGGRGWISQGLAGCGRGHGTRETCALHTARLSVDTLVDFWSALGEETRQSLLRMKEEDFIERLMYRFDSKRFCRDCRRNVIREFKELKELKRMHREPHCTNWFCVPDMAFQYEVSHDTVQADWHQTFVDTYGTYHHFEWAVGTGEGKADILEFENVGLSARVQVNGLDLSCLNACYITLRAWKMDGRCTEVSVKAHALKGQQCVHCRLVVGDGFVTITRGESIRRFFEHAEEAEEEEDDDSTDKDGNELDGDCSRPQKHAKSPELAREFLLDAATVIFKEQVEKAFREGTARQNAHSIFVCLALKLLEERVHVACKEIITLEKQMKLLEEEEKEKREEEERKERRRMKEREKKLRRKERLREKEKDREKKCSESNQTPVIPDVAEEESSLSVLNESNVNDNGDVASETVEAVPSWPLSPDICDEQDLNEYYYANMQNYSDDCPDRDFASVTDGNGLYANDHPKYSHRKVKYQSLKWSDRRRYAVVSDNGGTVGKSESRCYGDSFDTSARNINGLNKPSGSSGTKSGIRNIGSKFVEKFHCPNNRTGERYEFHACSCNQQNDYRMKLESHSLMIRSGREIKSVSKSESASDISKSYYRGNKYNQVEYIRESSGRPKSRILSGNNLSSRDSHTKQVWEPAESHKKYPRSNSDSAVILSSPICKEVTEPGKFVESSGIICSDNFNTNPVETSHVDCDLEEVRNSSVEMVRNSQNESNFEEKDSKEAVDEEVELCSLTASSLNGTTDPSISSISNSDNCSSCLSEGDSNTSSSNNQNPESSSTSDSEDLSEHSEARDNSSRLKNGFPDCSEVGMEEKQNVNLGEAFGGRHMPDCAGINASEHLVPNLGQNPENGKMNICIGSQPQGMLPPSHNQSMHYPMFQAPAMGYYQQSPVTWPATPANGFMPFPHPSPYIFGGPFGYTLNGNSRLMQYGALHQLTPPTLNQGQLPVFHPVAHANGVKVKEPSKVSTLDGVKEAHREPNIQRVIPTGLKPLEPLPNTEVGQNVSPDKLHTKNAGFSLFHFGGPVDLSTGYNLNSVSSKEGITGDISPEILSDHRKDDHDCNKKDTIEEYNLFATSNGIRFSIF